MENGLAAGGAGGTDWAQAASTWEHAGVEKAGQRTGQGWGGTEKPVSTDEERLTRL